MFLRYIIANCHSWEIGSVIVFREIHVFFSFEFFAYFKIYLVHRIQQCFSVLCYENSKYYATLIIRKMENCLNYSEISIRIESNSNSNEKKMQPKKNQSRQKKYSEKLLFLFWPLDDCSQRKELKGQQKIQ